VSGFFPDLLSGWIFQQEGCVNGSFSITQPFIDRHHLNKNDTRIKKSSSSQFAAIGQVRGN